MTPGTIIVLELVLVDRIAQRAGDGGGYDDDRDLARDEQPAEPDR